MNVRGAIVLAATAGCSWGAPTHPVLVGVSPTTLVAGEAGVLVLTATGLTPSAAVDFDEPARSPVCDAFRVELREPGGPAFALLDVVRAGEAELRGRVPAEAARTVYDVALVDPWGQESALAGAFEVVKCLPPGATCSDGNSCTENDACTGVNRCAAGTPRPDGTPCTDGCTAGEVPGTCQAGACEPDPGTCPLAPAACAAP